MPILRSNLSTFVEDLTPFLDDIVGGDFSPWPAIASSFLNSKTMDSGWTEIGTRSGLGTFAVKGEISEQSEDTYLIGPKMRVAAIEYAKRVPTSRIAIEDARTFEHASALLAGVAKDLRLSADQTKEILGHDILNSTSYLTPDGIALFHQTNHTLLNGGTYGNLIPGSTLGDTTLEAAVLLLKQMRNDRGFPINQMPARLIVPLELEWAAQKILGTDRKLGGNNNDINVMARQGLELVVSPLLTSSTTWFVQAADHGLTWYDRETSRAWTDTDDNRGLIEQGMTFRCAIAASDPRGIVKCTA